MLIGISRSFFKFTSGGYNMVGLNLFMKYYHFFLTNLFILLRHLFSWKNINVCYLILGEFLKEFHFQNGLNYLSYLILLYFHCLIATLFMMSLCFYIFY